MSNCSVLIYLVCCFGLANLFISEVSRLHVVFFSAWCVSYGFLSAALPQYVYDKSEVMRSSASPVFYIFSYCVLVICFLGVRSHVEVCRQLFYAD